MFKCVFIKIRALILPFFICLFIFLLLLFSKNNINAAKSGLSLWANSILPSLLPFFIATELLGYTNVVHLCGKLLSKIMRPIFNVPGEGAFALLMGIISGYPVGAKIVSNFMEQGIVTKQEAERLLAFTNNSGPLFIIGTVGITLFGSTTIGLLLFVTHMLACITVGIVLRFFDKSSTISNNYHYNYSNKSVSISSLGEVLGKSITNSISTILMIGGFVVIFSVVISILNQSGILSGVSLMLSPVLCAIGFPTELIKPVLAGIVELTNGVSLVANTHIKAISVNIVSASFLLGFGGISVLLQVFSIISKAGLSIKTYAIGKLLQGIFSAIYTYIAICIVPFLQFNLPI